MARRKTAMMPPNTLFVLGAGVDAALGLPLMNNMFQRLNAFAKGEGKPVDRAIRKHVNPRFNLAAYAGDEGEHLGRRLLGTHVHLLPVIQEALRRHPTPEDESVQAIRTVVDQFRAMAEANRVEGRTAEQLHRIAGDRESELVADTLVDTDNIELQPLPRQAMRKVFAGVLSDVAGLTEAEKSAFELLVAALSNFEELLGDFFAGYFTKSPIKQMRYFYLSWLLWAYIRVQEAGGFGERDRSFYKTLADVGAGSQVITFNYTDFFFGRTRPRDGYFHGDLKSYIRFDNRQLISDDAAVNEAGSIEKLAAFIASLPVKWGGDVPETYLPGIVPPLAVKPIICTEYLDRWYKCGQMIGKAGRIVIVGYSFNFVDEHFNDLIRKQSRTARIVVINPSLDSVISHVCRITSEAKADLSETISDGLQCVKGGRLTFVRAKAEQVEGAQLINLLRS